HRAARSRFRILTAHYATANGWSWPAPPPPFVRWNGRSTPPADEARARPRASAAASLHVSRSATIRRRYRRSVIGTDAGIGSPEAGRLQHRAGAVEPGADHALDCGRLAVQAARRDRGNAHRLGIAGTAERLRGEPCALLGDRRQ